MKISKLLFIILSWVIGLQLIACSKSEELPDTLELKLESIDFKSNSNLEKVVGVSSTDLDWQPSVETSGASWCQVKKQSNSSLLITLQENTNKEIRETTVFVKARTLSKTIKVRQLGIEPAILVSPSIFTVKSVGSTIDFTITSNIDFSISTPEWVSPNAKTRADEMVTTEHSYLVARNKGEKRTGEIIIKDKGSDLTQKIVIDQAGEGSYEADQVEGLKDDIIQKVVSGEASSFQPGSGIDKSFDNDMSTIYHSNWSNGGENYFPITLTYNFESANIDYLVYYPRTSGSNGHFKACEIQVLRGDASEFTTIQDVDFKGTGTASRFTFPTPQTDVKSVRIIVKSGSGDGQGFATCAEMQFYQVNPEQFDPLSLFTDATCSELKAGITEAEIEHCSSSFYKNMAYYMFVNKYPKEFRIQEFKAYPHPTLQSTINKTNPYSLLDNATGISVAAEEDLIVFAGELHNQDISLLVQNLDKPGGDGFGGISYPIVKGFNKVKMKTKGLVYVMYHTPDFESASPVKLHFASGSVNGYFDVRKHKAEDWSTLLNNATDQYFDVLGKYAHLTFPVSRFKRHTSNGMDLINVYDEIARLEMEFMGLMKYDKVFKNRIYLHVMYTSYMYATWYHTAYNDETLSEICDVNKLRTGGIWGPAHEIGHCNQTRPGLLWAGTTECTNNILSLYVQTTFGNVSRIQGENMSGDGYTNRYEKAMCNMFVNKIPHGDEGDVFCKLVPFWQLQLYLSNVLNKQDFYKDIFEDVRNSPDISDHGQNQLDFVERCCNSAQLDLTDFFRKWGFLTPINVQIDDYGMKTLCITQQMIDATLSRIQAKGYAPAPEKFEYICDNNTDLYVSPADVQAGTATRSGNKLTMKNWKNVAAYEVYKGEKLIFASNQEEFTVNTTLDETTLVYAVSVKGDKVKVNF